MVTASLENFRRRSDGKDDNTWAQPPEPLTQALGDSFSVMITDLQSPSEIILQKVENAGKWYLIWYMQFTTCILNLRAFGLQE